MTFQDEIEDRLTPTLRRDLERQLPRLYGKARRRAALDLEPYEHDAGSRLPADCPYPPRAYSGRRLSSYRGTTDAPDSRCVRNSPWVERDLRAEACYGAKRGMRA
jgi:hypothetical protein